MQRQFDTYVGLPYQAKGRDRSGLDCWGLVRLVLAEQFAIEVPSYLDAYSDDTHWRAEVIAVAKEGWEKTDQPRAGDIAVFRVLGTETHVGIVTRPGYFLHVREGLDSVIERIDSAAWKHRLLGVYRYRAGASALTVSALPHPLQRRRVDAEIAPGQSLQQLVDEVRRIGQVNPDIPAQAVIYVDGEYIPAARWGEVVPRPGSLIEVRALAGNGGVGRLIATLGVAVFAAWAAPYLATSLLGINGAAALGSMGVAAVTGAVGVGINMVGSLLINAIFPVRPPMSNAPSGPQSMHMLQGGANQANPYGAIPIVLGRMRFTPPVGATTYVESDGSSSYLRMLLVWGFGPLQISDIRIADTPIEAFDEVEIETLTGLDDSAEDKAYFNSLYGKDVEQDAPQVELFCKEASIASATVSANTLTLTLDADHEYQIGDIALVYDDETLLVSAAISSLPAANQVRLPYVHANGTVQASKVRGSRWIERTLSAEADQLTVSLNFPQGLFGMSAKSGNTLERNCSVVVNIRQVGEGSWQEAGQVIAARTFNLGTAWYNTDNDAALEKVYRWSRISVNADNRIIVRTGAYTTAQYGEPSGTLLARLQADNYGLDAVFSRMPSLGPSEEELWQVCVFGDDVVAVVDKRGTAGLGSVSGCAATYSGRKLTVASGTITRAQVETISLRRKAKKAFSHNVSFNVARGIYEVRVRRTNDNSGMDNPSYDTCVVQTITGYANNRPILPPKPLAMSAIRIRATNQLNGTVQGVTGTVQTICPDWDSATSTWVTRPTRNPASLFRYVAQHPANAKRRPDSRINLVELADFHDFCRTNNFMFSTVVLQQQSLDDTLRDIAAAGRASPTEIDGKLTVVIDRPRTNIVQHFTPDNSWGFEAVRTLPTLPHAFRCAFFNEEKSYQPDELIVYRDGFSAANATLYESLNFPGITNWRTIHKHARFHLAQLILRPERYRLNTHREHIRCTRGDLVPCTHPVPMWGLGSGRIKNRISSTVLELDSPVPMDAGTSYTVRIREAEGGSLTRTVTPVGTDGYYTQITLTSSVTTTQGAAGNLFQFGALNAESAELIVLAITPTANDCAEILLADYSPAVYDSDDEVIPAFDSQITLPPTLLQTTIKQKPAIVSIVSDDRAMTRLSPGKYRYGIKVAFSNPTSLPKRVTHIEGQIDWAEDNTDDWQASALVPVAGKSILFDDVEEGDSYRLRLRYVDSDGRTGPWTSVQTHTVSGKMNPPAAVTGLRFFFTDTTLTTATVTIDWDDSPESDVVKYEVNNGTKTVSILASTHTEQATWSGVRTYTVRAVDAMGNKSPAASIDVLKTVPGTPTNFRADVVDNNVMLYWTAPVKTSLPIADHELRRGTTFETSTLIGHKAGAFTTVFETTAGSKKYWLRARDTDGKYGDPIALSVKVSEPPDFVLHNSFVATLTGTKSNVLLENGTLLMPVNTTETWASHFSTNGFASPQAQIDAGYPYFLQPTPSSGYYEETLDAGTVLGASKVVVDCTINLMAGTVDVTPTISTSDDGVNWVVADGVFEVFATAFRYVKVRLTATGIDNHALCNIQNISVVLSAKLKNDAVKYTASASDTSGTVVNFVKEFIDITAIVPAAFGTSSVTAVANFQDAVINGSYSLVSGLMTINATGHDLVAGQRVRLSFTSGALNGNIVVVTVASVVNANQYTVGGFMGADTSGNLSTYPQGMRVYHFNSTTGARVSGQGSVSIKGY